MHLLSNDYTTTYVWVDDEDETKHISPHFDYEDDAIEWRNRQVSEGQNQDS